jgi:hypothetical protein
MKTYLTINYTAGTRNEEGQVSVIRPRSAKTPTNRGAARIVAANLQQRGYDAKPSDISVTRTEEMDYQTR